MSVPVASTDRKGPPTPLSAQQMSCVVLVQIAEGLNSKHTLRYLVLSCLVGQL